MTEDINQYFHLYWYFCLFFTSNINFGWWVSIRHAHAYVSAWQLICVNCDEISEVCFGAYWRMFIWQILLITTTKFVKCNVGYARLRRFLKKTINHKSVLNGIRVCTKISRFNLHLCLNLFSINQNSSSTSVFAEIQHSLNLKM